MYVHIIPFIISTLVTNLTPGAAMTYNISMTIRYGKWRGLIAALGVELGTLAYVLIAAFGLSKLIISYLFFYKILKLGGEVYLLYLAYAMLPKNKVIVEEEKKNNFLDNNAFLGGFFLNVMNPQMLFFFITILPQFVSVESQSNKIFFILGMTFNLCSLIVNSLLVLLSDKIYSSIKRNNSAHLIWLRYIPSIIFVLIAAYGLLTF